MTATSPFMTPGQSRQRRALAARRRRQRQLLGLGLLGVAVLAAVGAMAFAGSSNGGHGDKRAPEAHHALKIAKAPVLSPAGLTLAKPSLALTGITTPARDPI